MDDEEVELKNPFPSPPSHYTKYTTHNLKLLALLKEKTRDGEEVNQKELLADETDVPDWDLRQLEKPRVDWILDESDAYYDVFGDRWLVKDRIPSLAELGGNQLYPADPCTDRRPALSAVLRSMLVTYSSLTAALLAPPPTNSATVNPDWQRHVEWITVLGQNLMAAANDLRPVQARANLELMMNRQLELRKQETSTLQAKCDALEAKLLQLRAAAKTVSLVKVTDVMSVDLKPSFEASFHQVDHDDVLAWADEIGMAIRRRVGVSSGESARRQLMQPVALWEKAWVAAENGPANMKIYKWVRTEKTQHFSDDEGTVDEPLVPLPDEPEMVEVDDEDQDENNVVQESEQAQNELPPTQEQPDEQEEPENSKQSSPKLTMTLQSSSNMDDTDTLDASLKAGLPEGTEEKMNEGVMQLDTSALGPDGIALEAAHSLVQLDPSDALMGGPLLDETVDPFVTT